MSVRRKVTVPEGRRSQHKTPLPQRESDGIVFTRDRRIHQGEREAFFAAPGPPPGVSKNRRRKIHFKIRPLWSRTSLEDEVRRRSIGYFWGSRPIESPGGPELVRRLSCRALLNHDVTLNIDFYSLLARPRGGGLRPRRPQWEVTRTALTAQPRPRPVVSARWRLTKPAAHEPRSGSPL